MWQHVWQGPATPFAEGGKQRETPCLTPCYCCSPRLRLIICSSRSDFAGIAPLNLLLLLLLLSAPAAAAACPCVPQLHRRLAQRDAEAGAPAHPQCNPAQHWLPGAWSGHSHSSADSGAGTGRQRRQQLACCAHAGAVHADCGADDDWRGVSCQLVGSGGTCPLVAHGWRVWAHVQLDVVSGAGWQPQQPALVLVLVRGLLIDLVCRLLHAAAVCAAGCAAPVAAGLVPRLVAYVAALPHAAEEMRGGTVSCTVETLTFGTRRGIFYAIYASLFMQHSSSRCAAAHASTAAAAVAVTVCMAGAH